MTQLKYQDDGTAVECIYCEEPKLELRHVSGPSGNGQTVVCKNCGAEWDYDKYIIEVEEPAGCL